MTIKLYRYEVNVNHRYDHNSDQQINIGYIGIMNEANIIVDDIRHHDNKYLKKFNHINFLYNQFQPYNQTNHIKRYQQQTLYELHAPSTMDFLNQSKPPSHALFYFTEKGYKLFSENLRLIENYFHSAGYNTRLKIIDLSQIKQYTCYYQDDFQMCISLNEL